MKVRVGQIQKALNETITKYNGYVDKNNYRVMETEILRALIEFDKINFLDFENSHKDIDL